MEDKKASIEKDKQVQDKLSKLKEDCQVQQADLDTIDKEQSKVRAQVQNEAKQVKKMDNDIKGRLETQDSAQKEGGVFVEQTETSLKQMSMLGTISPVKQISKFNESIQKPIVEQVDQLSSKESKKEKKFNKSGVIGTLHPVETEEKSSEVEDHSAYDNESYNSEEKKDFNTIQIDSQDIQTTFANMNEAVKIKFVSALEEYVNAHLKQIKHKDK